jgi:hypothetical protein
MKKLTLLILHFTFSILHSFAQTNVSGHISANSTWNLAGSPYIITAHTYLDQGYTLTINPGVIVKFNAATGLEINGELIAIGTSANRITITANSGSPTTGFWENIAFTDTCVDAQYNGNGDYVSGCILRYCDISYGGGGPMATITTESCYPHIANCSISYSGFEGIFGSNSIFSVDSCVFNHCGGEGMFFPTGITNACPVHMNYDTLWYDGGGINISGGECSSSMLNVNVTHSYFKGNRSYGGLVFIGGDLILSENVFEGNGGQTLPYAIAAYIMSANSYVECNRFINNFSRDGSAIVYIDNGNQGSNVITDNIFDGNVDSSSFQPMTVLYAREQQGYTVLISKNIFKNNTSPQDYGLYLEGIYDTNSGSLFQVDSNEFQGNTFISDILCTSGGSTTTAWQNFLIHHNNFTDSAVQYALYDDMLWEVMNVNADNNYWNSTSPQHADSVIYDHYDNPSDTYVYYNPILTSPVVINQNCPGITTDADNIMGDGIKLFSIYPNPSAIVFNVSISERNDGKENYQLQIFDLTGRCVYEKEIGNSKLEIRDADMRQGIYFVKVSSGERSETHKLIIQ